MRYQLGIDLGTTFSAAAASTDEGVAIVPLGTQTTTIPSLALVQPDGPVLIGDAALRRAMVEPERVARNFKRHIGDQTPLIVGGAAYGPEALTARLLETVVHQMVSRHGGVPERITLAHPAHWGPYKLDLLGQAVTLAGLDRSNVDFAPEACAAATAHAAQHRVEPGETLAVYDLGGGTFDAAVVRRVPNGFEVVGQPEGVDRLGGIDIDAAILGHISARLGGRLQQLDTAQPGVLSALVRLRRDCVAAKETLSTEAEASISVAVPGCHDLVRLTRADLEQLIRPAIAETIAVLQRVVESAGTNAADLSGVLLMGESSRIPLVSQMVSAGMGRPVAIGTHPKHAVALGSAWLANGGLSPASTSFAPPAAPAPDVSAPSAPTPSGSPPAGTPPLPQTPPLPASATSPPAQRRAAEPPVPDAQPVSPAATIATPPTPPLSSAPPLPDPRPDAADPPSGHPPRPGMPPSLELLPPDHYGKGGAQRSGAEPAEVAASPSRDESSAAPQRTTAAPSPSPAPRPGSPPAPSTPARPNPGTASGAGKAARPNRPPSALPIDEVASSSPPAPPTPPAETRAAPPTTSTPPAAVAPAAPVTPVTAAAPNGQRHDDGHEATVQIPAVPESLAQHLPPNRQTDEDESPAVVAAQTIGPAAEAEPEPDRAQRWDAPVVTRASPASRWLVATAAGLVALGAVAALATITGDGEGDSVNTEISVSAGATTTEQSDEDLVRVDEPASSTTTSTTLVESTEDEPTTAEPGGPAPARSVPTSNPKPVGATTSRPASSAPATTPAPTTTTPPATTTTSSATTSTTAGAAAIQITTAPSTGSIDTESFSFTYLTNDVCGDSSFSVKEKTSGTLIGSRSGDGGCSGPRHGGSPGSASFPEFALDPGTTYVVSVTVKGTASDGSRPAGTGTDSATFEVTTSSAPS